MISRIIVYVCMILLLAAHFSRAEHPALSLITLALPFLLLVKRKWVIQALQGVAYLAASVWLYSAYVYIQARAANGENWLRLLLILGAVALFSIWAGFFLRSPQVEARYGFTEKPSDQN